MRIAISAEMDERPFRMRDTCTRDTPKRCATTSIVMPSGRNSRRISPGCGGLCIRAMVISSVIVLVVHQDRIDSFEREREPPARVHPHRPIALHVALQRMKLPARGIHVPGLG